jgi:saccharopine dehydrogenase-like NADP-dependent oxidoreductase
MGQSPVLTGGNAEIIVLGGAGDMGSRAVEDLVISSGVDLVTIADRNLAAAEKLATSLRGRGAQVKAQQVDADDPLALVEAIRGHDVAASGLGPFFRYETKLASAAIEAGADYASICDDWSAAQAVLAELDEPARSAGRIILTGLGASPGITNVGIRYLAGQLDHIRRVDVNVYQPLNAGGGEAVLKHMLHHQRRGRRMAEAGKSCCRPAEVRTVEFPVYGRIKVWNMGHTNRSRCLALFPGWRSATSSWALGVAPACSSGRRERTSSPASAASTAWPVSWRPWSG